MRRLITTAALLALSALLAGCFAIVVNREIHENPCAECEGPCAATEETTSVECTTTGEVFADLQDM